MCKTSYTQYSFSHCLMTNCAASSQTAMMELADLAKLVNFKQLAKFMETRLNSQKKRFLPPGHLYTEHNVYGVAYLHWPAWASWLCSLPAPAHLLSQTWETEISP